MSYKATAWAWDLQLDSSRKLVLLALADMADESFSCFPGQERLAAMTGMTARSVRNCLVELDGSGLLTRLRRSRDDGTRTSDRYVLNVGADLPENSATGKSEQDNRKTTTGLPEPVSAHSNQLDNQLEEPPVLHAYADDFEDAWKHWPRKNDKARAHKVWLSLAKSHPRDMAAIKAAVMAHGDQHTRIGTPQQYVPYLKTWLSGQLWNDPLPQARTSQQKQPAFKKALDVVAYFAEEEQREQDRALEAAHNFFDH